VVEAEDAGAVNNIIMEQVKELSDSWKIEINGHPSNVTHYRDIEIEDINVENDVV